MRRRNREINIFNLSMLDVIAGAMAAFLILVVVLMPYYRKEHIDYQAIIAGLRQQLEDATRRVESAEARAAAMDEAARQAQATAETALEQARTAQAEAEAAREQSRQAQTEAQAAREQARQAQQQAEQQRRRADAMARELAKTFLVLYVRWNTGDDVDLHVVDPTGAEFYFGHKTIPGRPGELSEDTINGPGTEVWEIRDAPPGEYRIYVQLYEEQDPRNPVVVQGRAFHRDGSDALPVARLGRAKEAIGVAIVRVDAEGNVSVH